LPQQGLQPDLGHAERHDPRVCLSSPVLFLIDDLQDRLTKGVHSSLFEDDSTLWVHSSRKEDAVPVLEEGVKEVYRWARAKKLTLNLKVSEVFFFSADPHEAKWQPVVEVEETKLRFNPTPLFLGVELGRTLSRKEQADSKAASLTKGSRVLMGGTSLFRIIFFFKFKIFYFFIVLNRNNDKF
jgi:hypothetical protein